MGSTANSHQPQRRLHRRLRPPPLGKSKSSAASRMPPSTSPNRMPPLHRRLPRMTRTTRSLTLSRTAMALPQAGIRAQSHPWSMKSSGQWTTLPAPTPRLRPVVRPSRASPSAREGILHRVRLSCLSWPVPVQCSMVAASVTSSDDGSATEAEVTTEGSEAADLRRAITESLNREFLLLLQPR